VFFNPVAVAVLADASYDAVEFGAVGTPAINFFAVIFTDRGLGKDAIGEAYTDDERNQEHQDVFHRIRVKTNLRRLNS
jgi:hypothetical protein